MRFCSFLVALLTLVGSVATAQQLPEANPDKEVSFRFYKGCSAFIFPGDQNQTLFKEMCGYIDAHRNLIESGSMPIRIYGYCGTNGTERQRAKRVRLMSNRVKSELIVARKAIEDNFITKNSTEPYSSELPNAVIVQFILPNEEPTGKVSEPKEEVETQVTEEVPLQTEPKEPITQAPEERPAPEEAKPAKKSNFSVRTNLLYWLGATPNLGVEWQPSRSVGILVNGGYAPWASNSWKHNFGGWFVSPEVRWYLGEQKRWFVGAQFLTGGFNVKLNDTGRQGDFIAGGITGGYKMRLSDSFDMDFSLGLGYGQFKYDTYRHAENGYNVYTGKGITKNTFMPTQLGVSLIWKIK